MVSVENTLPYFTINGLHKLLAYISHLCNLLRLNGLRNIRYRQCIRKLFFFVSTKQNGNKVVGDSWLSRPALQSEKLSEG